VILRLAFVLGILALDATAAASTQATIEFMVVEFTVRLVSMNIKLCRHKRRLASRADKASLVVLSSEPSISRRNTLSGNGHFASLAIPSRLRNNGLS
jgi:hypothetical protein